MRADVAFAMSVLVTLGTLTFGAWRFAAAPQPSPIASALLALGAALLAGLVATAAAYAIPMRAVHELGLGLAIPVVVYMAVLIYARVRRKVELAGLIAFGAVGALALWFVGFYALLITACAFGDCL
jgi:hypothetical protein